MKINPKDQYPSQEDMDSLKEFGFAYGEEGDINHLVTKLCREIVRLRNRIEKLEQTSEYNWQYSKGADL